MHDSETRRKHVNAHGVCVNMAISLDIFAHYFPKFLHTHIEIKQVLLFTEFLFGLLLMLKKLLKQ